ncbi:MAG TPA: SDR family oxidoreductase [Candidatus Synoicihabitans sp.]|nr:SDR family oxidoreductase [Candidatus Synoicihabitans sp.]
MKYTFKPLQEQVIVITGASSGIGLATAKAAARAGARLVVAARNDDALSELVNEIKANGGDALHVTVDVGSREDMQRLADEAIARFGGFDTWVNNAGVSIYGRLDQVTDEDHHRLFQTNFWGVVYGSLIAAKHLRERGGALINVGSVLSDQAAPLQGMYSATKHAVKGFTDALRMELEEDQAPISVTLIKPAAIDTPYPQHARNYTNQEPSLPPPVYAPEEVAKAILFAATHAKRDIFVGSGGRAMSWMNRIAPRAMDRVGERILSRQQLRNEPPREPEGALHRAGVGGHTRGDYPGYVMRRSFYTRASMHPMVTGALLGAVGVAAVTLMARRERRPLVGLD